MALCRTESNIYHFEHERDLLKNEKKTIEKELFDFKSKNQIDDRELKRKRNFNSTKDKREKEMRDVKLENELKQKDLHKEISDQAVKNAKFDYKLKDKHLTRN